MDEEHILNYIKQQIDKTFGSNITYKGVREENLEDEFFFVAGYLQACVNFHIISTEMYADFIKYCDKLYKIKATG